MITKEQAYDMVDRFLRNNMDDEAYAEYSDALDTIYRVQQPDSKPSAQVPEGFAAVSDELRKAMTKFPTWPTDPIHALAVLGEEFGELTKAVLQQTYEPHKTSIVEIRKEAIQTAAMALRWAASMSEYQYAPCKQHEQSFLAAMLNQSADQPQEG